MPTSGFRETSWDLSRFNLCQSRGPRKAHAADFADVGESTINARSALCDSVWTSRMINYSASRLLAKLSKLRQAKPSLGKPSSRRTTTPHLWESFRKLLDRLWLSHMWTLQEIILPQHAVILRDRYEWAVDDFLDLTKFVHDNQGEEDLGVYEEEHVIACIEGMEVELGGEANNRKMSYMQAKSRDLRIERSSRDLITY